MTFVAGQTGQMAWINEVDAEAAANTAKGLVHDAALATLPGTYATQAASATKAEVASLQAQSASIEDLFVSGLLVPVGVVSVTSSFSAPVLIAPFPLVVTSIALTQWGSSIPASDTVYWSITAQAADATAVQRAIATRTTQVVGGGAITSRVKWTFDATGFTTYKTLAAGDILSLACFPTGAPTGLGSPMLVTVGYRPL